MVQSADEPETTEDLEFIQNESKLVMERLQVYSIKCLCIYLFGNKMFQIAKEKINQIQQDSVGQFGNKEFDAQREFRLTASLFGKVIH
jgi:hypothetical protein